jgi:hypothetical protein
MKKLTELLENTQASYNQQEQKQPMQQHGLIKSDGQSTIRLMIEESQAVSVTQLPSYLNAEGFDEIIPTKNEDIQLVVGVIKQMELQLKPAKDSEEGRNRLGTCLMAVLTSQKGYGSKMDKDVLRARKSMFMAILGEYPAKAIEDAFMEYCTYNDDLPAPANIKEIIDDNWKLKKHKRICGRLHKSLNKALETGIIEN